MMAEVEAGDESGGTDALLRGIGWRGATPRRSVDAAPEARSMAAQ
jgi:hypothetical protein